MMAEGFSTGTSSRGKPQREEVKTQCEFHLRREVNLGILVVEAFTFTGCMFYFTAGYQLVNNIAPFVGITLGQNGPPYLAFEQPPEEGFNCSRPGS